MRHKHIQIVANSSAASPEQKLGKLKTPDNSFHITPQGNERQQIPYMPPLRVHIVPSEKHTVNVVPREDHRDAVYFPH